MWYVAVVEEILRTCVSYDQTDWEEMIPHIEFVINTQNKETLTGFPMCVHKNHDRPRHIPPISGLKSTYLIFYAYSWGPLIGLLVNPRL